GPAAGVEEVAPREQGAAAGGTGGGVDEGPAEQHPLAGDAVDVGRLDDLVGRGPLLHGGEGAGVAAPVVGEAEEDVEALLVRLGGARGEQAGDGHQRSDHGLSPFFFAGTGANSGTATSFV